MTQRTCALPPRIAAPGLTDEERAEMSRKVAEANKRSEQGRGGGQG